MARIKEISPDGSPTVSNTMTMVTKPACGIPAAPILAAVAVMLDKIKINRKYIFFLMTDYTSTNEEALWHIVELHWSLIKILDWGPRIISECF